MSGKKDNNANDNRERYREVQERLYQCYNMEKSNLWQRSGMISAIVVLCYTGYGALLLKSFDGTNSTISFMSQQVIGVKNDCPMEYNEFHLWLAIVSFLGVVFSILFILMAKGSKAWQEAFENAINDLEFNFLYQDLEYIGNGLKYDGKVGWWMGSYLYLYSDKYSNCFLCPKAGCFSPSKINIVIGIVSFIIFGIANNYHLYQFLSKTCHIEFVSYLIVYLILLIIIIAVLYCCTVSDVLMSKIASNK